MRKALRSGVLAFLGLAATAAPVLASAAAAPAASAAPTHAASHHYVPGLYHEPVIGKHVLPGLGSYLGLGDNSVRHATAVSSSNWSGYADVSETYNSVSASWTEPTVNCSSGTLLGSLGSGLLGGLSAGSLGTVGTSLLGGPSAAAAFWVGLDGYNSSSVEQLGTDSDCDGSTPTYYAWYEMYPNPSEDLSNPVSPGDSLTASVVTSGSDYTLSIKDNTKGWSYSTTQSGDFDRSSAEVIAEAPEECTEILCSEIPLADFGQVNFTGSAVSDSSGTSGGLSAFPADEITMASSTGTTEATPSSLNDAGADFSVTWNNS
ncbi:MAG TPA: G1 family glutamic endopeptidase [Acidimicrobiales bacterium]|jgi:hypothetical protein|nr:G1 family glutamic endopeptidase [Acidimicrobiales bacterium]